MTTAGLLSGIRVLDLSRILAGPWASQTLADLGADVVKLEQRQGGDDTRHWGPPFVEASSDSTAERTAAYFLSCNRGKRSLAVDFTDADDLALVQKLAAKADVMIENFRVGGLQKFRLDYPRLSAINPSLIYCSITGFGQTGPDAAQAGYDAMIQARGGLMSITGEAGGEPVKVGVAVADLMTGMYAATSICAALYRRAVSGEGEYIDLALLDVQAAMLANQAMNYLVGNQIATPQGSAHPNIVPYQVFQASDAPLMLAVGNDSQFRKCCALLGAEALADDRRFTSNAGRVEHRQMLIPAMQSLFHLQPRAHWLNAFSAAGVPAGPVQSIDEVMADKQLLARQMFGETQIGDTGYRQLRSPIKLNRHAIDDQRGAPTLDQHRQQIVQDWLSD
ncbi:CaiB/BaiF CoA transferase family protein [Permianibacter aggregans]|uniref:Formyl-CoA transferase n=1 Tax=Permianibacter aggregans TaxID=1510150 RepID=A0A4R6UV89_9GAMM|nr:CoA transferase [Permianibacter aggregans]QGX39522.1 CoA transferase [Permianibacter aggregans]TDQ49733.1 formyl-CoA transferase [Permianibacter aggregans]